MNMKQLYCSNKIILFNFSSILAKSMSKELNSYNVRKYALKLDNIHFISLFCI